MTKLSDDIRRLTLLKRREAILKRRTKDATRRRVEHERAVFDRMVDEGWTLNESTLALEGVQYKPASTDYATVQDKDALMKWLAENDEGLIETKFRDAELNRLVRERLDNGQPLPPGLGYYSKEYISASGLNAQLKSDTETQEDNDNADD